MEMLFIQKVVFTIMCIFSRVSLVVLVTVVEQYVFKLQTVIKEEMFRFLNLSAVILIIGMLQLSVLSKINLEELFYPIRLLGHQEYIPKQNNKVSTGYSNPKLKTLLATPKDNNDYQTQEKETPNRRYVFDSPIPANHEADPDLNLDSIEVSDDRSNKNIDSHRIPIFDSSIPTKYKEDQESRNIPVKSLSIETVTGDDQSNQNKESHRISVFDSSISTKHKDDQENREDPVQGLTIETVNDQLNQNQESHRISVFDSSIPLRYDEDQDHRKAFVQGLTMDTIPDSNDQANPKQKLHRISVFDASVQGKHKEIEQSKEMKDISPGLSIPIKGFNKVNPEIDSHRLSIFDTSSSQKNKQQGGKEGIEYKEDDEEENETGAIKSLEEKFISKATSTRDSYKDAEINPNEGLHRISVFDSPILSKSEEDVNLNEIPNPETVQRHRYRHELPGRRKEFYRSSGFDSSPFYPESVSVIDQTLLNDDENLENELKRIPIPNSSLPVNEETYFSGDAPRDRIYANSSSLSQTKEQANLKKKSHKKRKRKHKLKKKKLKKNKFVFDSTTIYEYKDNLVHLGDNLTVADAMARSVRVLCWVMTYPANHDNKAKHVKATWGRRCNTLLFMSTEEDPSLPTVKLPVTEDYNHLWGKTKAAFRYIHKHHMDDADWFLKADDDTYVIVENLRYMLVDFNRNDPIYFGFRFKASHCPKQGYTSGGAGYVLSREALDRFVTRALPSPHLCNKDDTGVEDAEIGQCLEHIGVMLMDSRDYYQRDRFFPFLPHDHVDVKIDPEYWFWKMVYYPMKTGRDCCSEYAISFHYVDAPHMYALEYFIYHLRPFGISYKFDTIYNDIHK